MLTLAPAVHTAGMITVTEIPGEGQPNAVVVHGVRAGAFDPAIWQAGTLNLLPDARHPLLEPQEGNCRNIYAPSAVQVPGGWRVFFGAWDGVPTGNDRIYSVETGDFSAFTNRHTVIEHGKFQHVCNVSAIAEGTSGFALCCTAYPDKDGLNKPAYFSSPDGLRWNGSPAPYTAQTSDIVSMTGYAGYAKADINGMNVLLREDGKYRLYFCNFKDFGKIMRASGTDGRDFIYDGVALAAAGMVNDVKKFAAPDGAWYLMGIHANGPELYQSLSRDGMRFGTSHTLLRHLDDADRHIVAIGWVTEGEQDAESRKVLGVLYGAGAVKSLDQNRIFARWLQKRVMFTPDFGESFHGTRSVGPDSQVLPVPSAVVPGVLKLYAEDGRTLLGRSRNIVLERGKVYEVSME